MFLALAALVGCLDYEDLVDSLEEDEGRKGDDDDDDDDDGDRDGDGGRGDDTTDDEGGDGGRGDDDDDDGGRGDDDDDDAGGEEVDQVCVLGVSAFCVCATYYDYPCSEADMEAMYAQCVAGQDQGLFECMTDFVEDDVVDCYPALSTCLADYEG